MQSKLVESGPHKATRGSEVQKKMLLYFISNAAANKLLNEMKHKATQPSAQWSGSDFARIIRCNGLSHCTGQRRCRAPVQINIKHVNAILDREFK
jgi:hypothetical protein